MSKMELILVDLVYEKCNSHDLMVMHAMHKGIGTRVILNSLFSGHIKIKKKKSLLAPYTQVWQFDF